MKLATLYDEDTEHNASDVEEDLELGTGNAFRCFGIKVRALLQSGRKLFFLDDFGFWASP